ncbi:NitT/TauT family transport system permease protein [Anaerovibrio lipolyticus DSM 3074]|uniref:ABC transporter permease n=2 Tax=Anaerovibrio lipolyticus TaxID=82374 RepID=A0A0B2K2E7_9FIRM|nr:ABC transporter permease [Anaerovibrio lipolyticus]KHM52946.1 ABC transporter permease [Anaerovibrio lipolyticus]MBE6105952.1 ABC transporter permease [Anaerovibrio lipolyticus]SHI79454.1 NitT/TauT family transport system permease protein [Anaerovibrio lipolyticus DSM 3074]
MGKLVSLWYLLAAVVLTLVWFVVSQLVDLPIIPSPVLVVENLADIFMKYIAIHSLYSLWRIGAGLLLAVAVGLPLGVIMGYFPQTDRFLAPVVYLTYPIPKIALLPILMLLFGVGELSKVFMIFLIIVFQVVVAVRDGIRAIPNETYYPLYSLGASFKDIFFEVLWPASLPKFITAIRVALATAISVLFFTETFGTQYGMGYFIMDAWLRVNYLEMYSGIVVLSLLGLILFTTIDLIERNACHWQYK